jgi:O-antigen ligase
MILRIEKSELPYPVEFFWLFALAFFLPLFEAPKNICWLGYLLTWLYNRIRERNWGGTWDRWDSLIALWIVSGYVVAWFSGVHRNEWGDANDLLRYCTVLWLAKRSRFSERSLLTILGVLVGSTLVTLAWGAWGVYIAGTETALTLNSVGHVNHSAIYISIVFGVALSLTLAYWARMSWPGRLVAGVMALVLSFAVFLTDSRAAAASAFLLAMTLSLTFTVRKARRAAISFLAVVLGGTVLLVASPAMIEKTANQIVRGDALAYRGHDWGNALTEWRQFPLFGVGMGNYGVVTLEELRDWNKRHNWAIHPSAEGVQGHGHSLYFNALAERGLVGFAILLAVLVSWGTTLIRAVPRTQDPPLDWALSGAAFSGWFITVIVGFVNTTLHHENGILAALLLGLWLSWRARFDPPERPGLRS